MLILQWKHSRKTTGGWLVYDVAAYEKLFSEKDRNEIKKMRLPFKDLMIVIQTAMELIQGEEDQGEQ